MPVSLAIRNYAVNIKGVNKMAIEFLNGFVENGELKTVKVRSLQQESIRKCPHFIFAVEHYRDDESCRCDDKAHKEMKEWGYKWKSNRWQ